ENNANLNGLKVKQSIQKAWANAYSKKRIYEAYAKIDSVFSGLNKAIDLRYETQAISKLEYSATANQGKLITLQKEQAYTSYQMALQNLNQWLFSKEQYDVATINLDDFDE
ncbi:hypothetical protein, partial [Pontimicrobium sp. MEBiC01747]